MKRNSIAASVGKGVVEEGALADLLLVPQPLHLQRLGGI
jgi:hypothetical protein